VLAATELSLGGARGRQSPEPDPRVNLERSGFLTELPLADLYPALEAVAKAIPGGEPFHVALRAGARRNVIAPPRLTMLS